MMVGDEKVSMDEGKQGTALAGRDDIGDRSPSQRVEVAEKDGSMDSQTRAFDEANQSDMRRVPEVLAKTRLSVGETNRKQKKCVLVAKCLTNSDASSGRIILPRVAVETNLPFVTAYRHYTLAVRDTAGQKYDFVVKSWANGTEYRRVFVLEQVSKFLKNHGVGVGDTVGICSDPESGDLVVEVNTEAVLQGTSTPRGSSQSQGFGGNTSMQNGTNSGAIPFSTIAGKCSRSMHCNKVAGHPGFCSGPKSSSSGNSTKSTGSRFGNLPPLQAKYAMPSDESNLGGSDAFMFGEDCSSDETAATHVAYVTQEMVDSDLKQLPEGLNKLVYVPPGVRMAKPLTSYDLSSRRIVLPAIQASESLVNLSDDMDVYTLAVVDESDGWHFMTFRTWFSVTGRRGFYIEDAGDFMKSRSAKPGDTLLIHRDSVEDPPRIVLIAEATSTLKKPVDGWRSSISFADLPVLLLPYGENTMRRRGYGRSSGSEYSGQGLCSRTNGCTKVYGHQGFCSGHRGFKRKESETPTSRFARHPFAMGSFDMIPSDEDDCTPSFSKRRMMSKFNEPQMVNTPRAMDDPLVSLLSLLE